VLNVSDRFCTPREEVSSILGYTCGTINLTNWNEINALGFLKSA